MDIQTNVNKFQKEKRVNKMNIARKESEHGHVVTSP